MHKTPAGTRVCFLVDVIDIDDNTGLKYVAARAGETGFVFAKADGPSDWPTVIIDSDTKNRIVIADLENPEEVEIIESR